MATQLKTARSLRGKRKGNGETETPAPVVLKALEEQQPAKSDKVQRIVITPPNMQGTIIRIIGTAPYVANKFSKEAQAIMMAKQEAGEQSRKGKKREPKDFQKIYLGMVHYSEDGWIGMPASAFRKAMVSACRLVGFKMVLAKLSVFVMGDGIDRDDGQPLIKIVGKPVRKDMPVRLANGSTDIMPRPFFHDWSAKVNLEWDADQFSVTDIGNLMMRVGRQVGIGAGRPDSTNSTGMGWGTFRIDDRNLAVVSRPGGYIYTEPKEEGEDD